MRLTENAFIDPRNKGSETVTVQWTESAEIQPMGDPYVVETFRVGIVEGVERGYVGTFIELDVADSLRVVATDVAFAFDDVTVNSNVVTVNGNTLIG